MLASRMTTQRWGCQNPRWIMFWQSNFLTRTCRSIRIFARMTAALRMSHLRPRLKTMTDWTSSISRSSFLMTCGQCGRTSLSWSYKERKVRQKLRVPTITQLWRRTSPRVMLTLCLRTPSPRGVLQFISKTQPFPPRSCNSKQRHPPWTSPKRKLRTKTSNWYRRSKSKGKSCVTQAGGERWRTWQCASMIWSTWMNDS
jgi:hypothetical protein